MTKKEKSPAGLTAREIDDAGLAETSKRESDRQSVDILQLSPGEKPRWWKEIYGRMAVRTNGEILINPAIFNPTAGLRAFIEGVAVFVEGEPIFVPVTWAIHKYPQYAEGLNILISPIERFISQGGLSE